MNWLNFHHLMYFRTIATEGSISKASRKLLVGQPALSAQLKQFESFFDHKFFERRNRKLILTDAGQATLKYANQIHSLGEELVEVLNNHAFSPRPHLTIGALDSIPKNLVVHLINTTQKFNECKVTSLDGNSSDLYKLLVNHSIDTLLTDHHVSGLGQQSVYCKSLGRFKIYAYGTNKYESYKKNFPQSLKNVPKILPTSHSKLRHDIEMYFDIQKMKVTRISEIQDTAIQKLLALQGAGVVFEPEFAVKPYLKSKNLVKLGELKGVSVEYFLSSTKRLVKGPITHFLMNKYEFKRPQHEHFQSQEDHNSNHLA